MNTLKQRKAVRRGNVLRITQFGGKIGRWGATREGYALVTVEWHEDDPEVVLLYADEISNGAFYLEEGDSFEIVPDDEVPDEVRVMIALRAMEIEP